MILPRQSWLVLALSFAPALAHAGSVRIAERPLVGPFTTIQAAVDAALEGESLIVEPGTYAPFTIDAKSVQLFDTGAGEATISGQVAIKNIGPAQFVVLSRLRVSGTFVHPNLQPAALEIANVSGNVRVQDSTFTGAAGHAAAAQSGAAVRMLSALNVVFSNCTIQAGDSGVWAGQPPIDGAPAVDSMNSSSAFYACTLAGGSGSESSTPRGGDGGSAYTCTSFGMFASGSTFQGGNGGNGDSVGCNPGGIGGDGVRVDAAEARLLDNVYRPGGGGASSCGPGAAAGQTIRALNGSVIAMLPTTSRRISAPRITADDARTPITIHGQAGDLVYLMVARTPCFVFKKLLNGVWMIPAPLSTTGLAVGRIGASGTLVVSRRLNVPDGSFAARLYWLQALCVDSVGQPTLTGPAQVLSFDAASAPDCNGNGRQDAVDVLFAAAADCDSNLTPDSCDPDCDGSGVPDTCELASGLLSDCNGNGVPDVCDLSAGAPDCNANGILDSCDIAAHSSSDVNSNGVPDECEAQFRTWYVDASAAVGGNGSPTAPFQSLRQGVSASFHGDTIVLADGLYTGAGNRDVDPAGRHIKIRSANGAANCTIDCEHNGRAISATDYEQVIIEGLTIRSGSSATRGGAIESSGAQFTLRQCVIEDCAATLGGGAIFSALGSLRLEDCLFIGNSATDTVQGFGGALHIDRSQVAVRDCVFASNTARAGGALFISHPTALEEVVFTHSTFLENHADVGGAWHDTATLVQGRAHKLDNCLFAGNTAALEGGALSSYASLSIGNSTFVSNSAVVKGGTMRFHRLSVGQVDNSILYGGSAQLGAEICLSQGSPMYPAARLTIAHSDVQGGQAAVYLDNGTLIWGAGNLDLNPQFFDADGPDNLASTFDDNDYTLAPTSPCIDAGDNGALSPDLLDVDRDGDTAEPVPLDLRHQPRRMDVLNVPDTGSGAAPIVDIGASEH